MAAAEGHVAVRCHGVRCAQQSLVCFVSIRARRLRKAEVLARPLGARMCAHFICMTKDDFPHYRCEATQFLFDFSQGLRA